MKSLLVALLVAYGTVASAGKIDSNLQATMLHPDFGKATADGAEAVFKLGKGQLKPVFGETSTMDFGTGPVFYFYIPVYGVRVPLSPTPPVQVGSIVGKLQISPNAPLPRAESVYFKTAPSPAD